MFFKKHIFKVIMVDFNLTYFGALNFESEWFYRSPNFLLKGWCTKRENTINTQSCSKGHRERVEKLLLFFSVDIFYDESTKPWHLVFSTTL